MHERRGVVDEWLRDKDFLVLRLLKECKLKSVIWGGSGECPPLAQEEEKSSDTGFLKHPGDL